MKAQRQTIEAAKPEIPQELIRSAASARLKAAHPILDWQGDEARRKDEAAK